MLMVNKHSKESLWNKIDKRLVFPAALSLVVIGGLAYGVISDSLVRSQELSTNTVSEVGVVMAADEMTRALISQGIISPITGPEQNRLFSPFTNADKNNLVQQVFRETIEYLLRAGVSKHYLEGRLADRLMPVEYSGESSTFIPSMSANGKSKIVINMDLHTGEILASGSHELEHQVLGIVTTEDGQMVRMALTEALAEASVPDAMGPSVGQDDRADFEWAMQNAYSACPATKKDFFYASKVDGLRNLIATVGGQGKLLRLVTEAKEVNGNGSYITDKQLAQYIANNTPGLAAREVMSQFNGIEDCLFPEKSMNHTP